MISTVFDTHRRMIMDTIVNVAQISVAVMQFSVAAALVGDQSGHRRITPNAPRCYEGTC
jgi:hypothetical protein